MSALPAGHLNLYITEIGEPSDNELRVVVTEGLLGEATTMGVAGVNLGEVRPIAITEKSRSFEVYWDNYVAYAVRNESFWKAEKGEPSLVNNLERRFDSAFQRYVFETTFADDEYPGRLEHWSLSTLNHIVDVISVGPPDVASVKP